MQRNARGFTGKDKTKDEKKVDKEKGGLNVEIHPLLKGIVNIPQIPKDHNPLKRKVRSSFDPTSINPYLDTSTIGGNRKKSRGLQFNEKGKYVEQGNILREKIELEQQEQAKLKLLQEKGLLADEEKGEWAYKHEKPPSLEWWDSFYVNGHNYDLIDDEKNIITDNETSPITIYIQHPIFLDAPNDKHLPQDKALYLTKKEMKRKRKNERQERFKHQQERIRLGLDAPPPPKVKLSNLMNVLTNEMIKDPTAIERKVKKDIEHRYKQHMKANEERKLTKEQKYEKIHEKHQQDLSLGYHRNVYRIDKLIDKQHFFKVDVNAKELELNGICLVHDKMTLLVIEGGAKTLAKYDKVMNRIKWTKSNNEAIDLSNNKSTLIWSGQIKDLQFKKWSIINVRNDDDLYSILNRFKIENYWRQASS